MLCRSQLSDQFFYFVAQIETNKITTWNHNFIDLYSFEIEDR